MPDAMAQAEPIVVPYAGGEVSAEDGNVYVAWGRTMLAFTPAEAEEMARALCYVLRRLREQSKGGA